jgi:DNA-binding NarL/FixJ family response regulator/predicted regulator of Ras-like GTPase activity (Roadblock/LC7/MglB family)
VTNHILIVDSDEAFATILQEGIQMGGQFQASVATKASDARDVAAQGHLAMAIVDMGLEDGDPLELLETLRERYPELRLLVIPLDDVPEEVLALGIQGTLPKPFFLPDIPAQIEEAMVRPVGAPPAEPEPDQVVARLKDELAEPEAPPTHAEVETVIKPRPSVPSDRMMAHLASESHRLTENLRYLSRELNADAVLLTYGTELVAYAGHFGRADAERLAQVVIESWQASARVAAALGREKVRFEQSLHEGEDYLLYSLAAAADIVLSVALRSDRPLGMIRYNTKQTAQDLEPLLTPR